MAIHSTSGVQRKINESWLNLYCAPFDFVDTITSLGYTIFGHSDRAEIEKQQEFKNWNIEYIEKIYGHIETTGLPYISQLREDSLAFWKNEADRDKFSFFLCNQYFRTKKMRDGIIASFEKVTRDYGFFTEIRPKNMWIPLSLIFASNLGAHIAHNYSAVFLQTETAAFVVGDQPVINTHSTFDMMTAPTDVELFYPVTPHSALLLTKNAKYTSGETYKLSADEVDQYNALEKRFAREMIFAKERSHLYPFICP